MSHGHDGHPARADGQGPGWDGVAARYGHAMTLAEPEMAKVTQAMLDAAGAGPGTRLLDLACGPGHATAAAAARGARALGVDRSAGMVREAARRFPAARFQVADMLEPPAGPWDAVVCRFGVHHADPAWARAAWEALGAGGRIAVAEFAADDAQAKANGMRDPGHWASLLRAAGFTGVEARPVPVALAGLARMEPALSAMARQPGSPFRDRTAYVVSGRKP